MPVLRHLPRQEVKFSGTSDLPLSGDQRQPIKTIRCIKTVGPRLRWSCRHNSNVGNAGGNASSVSATDVEWPDFAIVLIGWPEDPIVAAQSAQRTKSIL